MEGEYFQTRSKSLAYSLNYLGYRFYKFGDKDEAVYSFKVDDMFYERLEMLNYIKFKVK